MTDKISIEDQIKEVQRELVKRHHVYKRLIAAGNMTEATAKEQMAKMSAVLRTLLIVKKQNYCLDP